MIIKLSELNQKTACPSQIALFKKLFGTEVKVTRALCLKHAGEFDWGWAAEHLLSSPARRAYKKATAPAWKAYKKATAPAWKAYKEAIATAWKAYKKAIATAFFEASNKMGAR